MYDKQDLHDDKVSTLEKLAIAGIVIFLPVYVCTITVLDHTIGEIFRWLISKK